MKRLLSIAILSATLAACNTQTPVTETDTDAPIAAKRAAMEWQATQTGEDATGMPETTLTLTVPSMNMELYTTTCSGTASTEVQDMEDSVADVQCWWAGGGDQYGVFIGDGESGVIRHRTVDEEAGYGEWVDVKTL